MHFRVTCQLDYNLSDPASFLFALRCIETGGQRIIRESLVTEPFVEIAELSLTGGMNRFSRLRTWNPGTLRVIYQAEVTTTIRIIPVASLNPGDPGSLPPEA